MSRSIDPTTRRQLRTLLAQFYPDESSIRRVAADAGVDLSHVALNNHPTNDCHRVLDEAEFVNQLDALFDVVEQEYAARVRCLFTGTPRRFLHKRPTDSRRCAIYSQPAGVVIVISGQSVSLS